MDTHQARTQLSRLLIDLTAVTSTLTQQDGAAGQPRSAVALDRADTASALSDNGRETAILHAAGERIAEVTAALERLETGSWGVCVDCGKPIPEARLEARPEATRCVEDQARFEAALNS